MDHPGIGHPPYQVASRGRDGGSACAGGEAVADGDLLGPMRTSLTSTRKHSLALFDLRCFFDDLLPR